jgi:hypothetical protein
VTSADRLVRVNAGTLHRELQGEGVLLQLDTGEYFGLDAIGERMWTLLAEYGRVATVHAHLLEEFDVDAETLSRDLAELVDEFIRRRLLDEASGPAAAP